MGRRDNYKYQAQNDFRGGINQEPENARPNQVLDARNVWAPEGRLESRPGYVGDQESLFYTDDGSTNGTGSVASSPSLMKLDGGTYTIWDGAATTFSLVGLAAGESWFVGFTESPYDVRGEGDLLHEVKLTLDTLESNSISAKAEYWDGSGWRQFPFTEYGLDGVTTVETIDHLARYSSNVVTFRFNCPLDWAATTEQAIASAGDTTDRYWIRFTLQSQGDYDSTGDGVLDTSADTILASAVLGESILFGVLVNFNSTDDAIPDSELYVVEHSYPEINLGSLQSHVLQVPQATVSGSTAEQDSLYCFAKLKGDSIADRVSGTITTSNLATPRVFSTSVIPQFNEFHHHSQIGTFRVTQPLTVEKATVEDAASLVGEIDSIKSPYHPDYVAQLSSWPDGSFGLYFDDRLWVAGFEKNPFEVRWSAAAPAYRVWPVISYADLSEDDNSPITGLNAYDEHVIVFKRDSMWRMVFTGLDDAFPEASQVALYAPIKVASGIGTVAHRSVAQTPLGLMFLYENGIYLFDGAHVKKISEDIDPMIRRINWNKAHYATATHWAKYSCYVLSVPVDGSSRNNMTLVYDYKNKGWWFWDDFEPRLWVNTEDSADFEQLKFVDYYGRLSTFGVGNADYHSGIDSYLQTHRKFYGDYITKGFREVRVSSTNENSDLSVELIPQDVTKHSTTGTLNLNDRNASLWGTAVWGTDDWEDTRRRPRRLNFNKSGQWCSVKVSNSNADRPMKIDNITIAAIDKGRR